MPNPRLQVSLTPEHLTIIRRLAKHNRTPASKVVAEIIETAAPALSRVLETLDALQHQSDRRKQELRSTLDKAEQKATQAAQEALEFLDDMTEKATDGRRAADRRTRPHVSNRGATPPPRKP